MDKLRDEIIVQFAVLSIMQVEVAFKNKIGLGFPDGFIIALACVLKLSQP